MTADRLKKAEEFAYEGEFEKAYEILDGLDRDADAGCLFVSLARKLGQAEQAERELELILIKEPGHPRANHLKAMALLERGDLDEAGGLLRKAEKGYGADRTNELSELHTDWGNLHFERRDTIKAVLAWRRALKLAPENDVARKNLERFEDVRFDQAATINEMIRMARHPSQVLAHLMRAQDFKTPAEAEEFARYILSVWNQTPRGELGQKSPSEKFDEDSK
ncbi:hypothetical protein ACFL2T_02705 [Elusimicrobiota bacterium]